MNTIIQTPVNQLENSLAFYQKVGFRKLEETENHVFTDGGMLLEIVPDRFARAGIRLYRDSWKEEVAALADHVKLHQRDYGYLFSAPSGTWVYLIEGKSPYSLPEKHQSLLGNFAGLSLETGDMERSVAIFSLLGFKKTMGDEKGSWVALMNDDGIGVSFMSPGSCPHLFFNPSFTYFNGGNNLTVIETVRKLNIPIAEEISYFNKEGIVDNIIIRDPGGFGFFLFSD